MRDIISALLSFPPAEPVSNEEYDQRIRSLYSTLDDGFPYNVGGPSPDLNALLEPLDPSVHSLSYLFVLLAYHETERTKSRDVWPSSLRPGGPAWSKTLTFFATFDPVQMRYTGQEWRSLLEMVVSSAEAVSNPFVAIQPLRDAILRLDPDGSTFTSNHLLLTRLCLRTRAYGAALQVIEKDICHFPSGSDRTFLKRWKKLPCADHESSMTYITTTSGHTEKLTHKDHLQYFLYGGMIFLGLKKWEQALHLFELVIASPATSFVSLIMVEAYKKWVLASLLHKGTTRQVPKPTNSHALKAYRCVAKPYDALAEVFKTGNLERLRAEIEIGQMVWQNDYNTGLVLQVLDAFRKFSVLKLERTFTALSIAEVAQRAAVEGRTVEEVEAFVASLIASGELKGTLLQNSDPSQPTILRFATPTTDTSSETQMRDDLAAQKQRLSKLLGFIQSSDHKLEIGREYIDHLRDKKRKAAAAGKESAPSSGPAGGTVGEFDFDEDMMADLQ